MKLFICDTIFTAITRDKFMRVTTLKSEKSNVDSILERVNLSSKDVAKMLKLGYLPKSASVAAEKGYTTRSKELWEEVGYELGDLNVSHLFNLTDLFKTKKAKAYSSFEYNGNVYTASVNSLGASGGYEFVMSQPGTIYQSISKAPLSASVDPSGDRLGDSFCSLREWKSYKEAYQVA
jgi:hypothetical protein